MIIDYRNNVDYDIVEQVICNFELRQTMPGILRQRMFLTFAIHHHYENWIYNDDFEMNSKTFCENNVENWAKKWWAENTTSIMKYGVAADFYNHYNDCRRQVMAPVNGSCTKEKCNLSPCMLQALDTSFEHGVPQATDSSYVSRAMQAAETSRNALSDVLQSVGGALSVYTAWLLLPLVHCRAKIK